MYEFLRQGFTVKVKLAGCENRNDTFLSDVCLNFLCHIIHSGSILCSSHGPCTSSRHLLVGNRVSIVVEIQGKHCIKARVLPLSTLVPDNFTIGLKCISHVCFQLLRNLFKFFFQHFEVLLQLLQLGLNLLNTIRNELHLDRETQKYIHEITFVFYTSHTHLSIFPFISRFNQGGNQLDRSLSPRTTHPSPSSG